MFSPGGIYIEMKIRTPLVSASVCYLSACARAPTGVMMTDGGVSHQVMRKEESAVSGVIKRGIVEQCCHFSCDYYDLENYCNI